LYGTNLSWYNVMNATMSSILNAEPYNFPPAMVGVAYLSPVIGAGLSIIWSGTLSDWVVLRLARRNGGIREPEQRLLGLLVSGLVTSSGLILWGVGASKGVQFMGLIIGVGMVTFGVVCGGSISLAYAVDCFKDIAGESMITVIIIRNTLGFAFSWGINPWINNLGLQNCFVSVALIALACTYSFLIIIVIGKPLRKFSAKQYWKYVAEDRGMLSD
jgi:MFS family permease